MFGNFMILIPAMMLMNQIDLTNPVNLFRLRIAYFSIEACGILALVYIYFAIKSKADKRKVTVQATGAMGAPDPNGAKEEITVEEHDLRQLKKQFTGALFGAALSTFIHFKFGVAPPLFIQSVMKPWSIYEQPLVKLHILGRTTPELEKRPWKEPENPLAKMLGQGTQQPEAAEPAPEEAKPPAKANNTLAEDPTPGTPPPGRRLGSVEELPEVRPRKPKARVDASTDEVEILKPASESNN